MEQLEHHLTDEPLNYEVLRKGIDGVLDSNKEKC